MSKRKSPSKRKRPGEQTPAERAHEWLRAVADGETEPAREAASQADTAANSAGSPKTRPKAPKPPSDSPRRKRGRPTQFSQKLADRVCELLVAGATLSKICDDAGMPDRVTIWRWREAQPDFNQRYLSARRMQIETLGDDALDIADDEETDVQRARLKVDARQRTARAFSALYVPDDREQFNRHRNLYELIARGRERVAAHQREIEVTAEPVLTAKILALPSPDPEREPVN